MAAAQVTPPSLDGFTYLAYLGGGGFADVFLYQQHLPDRRVAVKVLRETVDDEEARRLFNAEANLMARVSTHPNIVTVYGAAVSGDRRPYLVMEYYPLAHFGDRIKQGKMPVHEVLEVGIKVASAVETAHRARIIHRDIKPGNILTSEFGEPGLTDFGISATQTDQLIDESMGFSPPYAPPEILSDEHPGNEQSDIYSLAATLWAMLAGHSPFEMADRKLSRSEIMSRGLNMPVPSLPRGDVPPSLEFALQNALAKDPATRPSSALSFARVLQGVEQEMGYRPTALNLLHDASTTGPAVLDRPDLEGEKTKIGKGKTVNPDGPMVAPPRRRDGGSMISAAPPVGAGLSTSASRVAPAIERLPFPAEADEPGTIKVRRSTATAVGAIGEERKMQGWAWVAAVAGLVGVLVVIGLVVIGGKGSSSRPSEVSVADQDPGPIGVAGQVRVDAVGGLGATKDGGLVHFTWKGSSSADVRYLVTRVDDGAGIPPPSTVVQTPSFDVVNVKQGDAPCVSVLAFIPGVTEAPRPAPTKCAVG